MAAARAQFDDRASARVEAVLRSHHGRLLWIARRWSGSADDAEDALQRAMEIYVRRLDSLDPATELAWLKVVVRHEAIAIRRARSESAAVDGDDVTERLPAPGAGVDERAERDERLAHSLEALARLKPDERTALLLKAEGYSYREIGERLGWTYTKVNRAITEGRRRFLGVFENIESGEECERFAPTLMALVQGAAAADDVVALRPHLRHCAGCRATVRELHAARRHRLALHIPLLAGIAPARWLGERLADGPTPRPLLHGVLQRFGAPDVTTGMQLASGSGGGRGTAVAALVSLCLGGGAAGSYCVATGVLPDPTRIVRDAGEPGEKRAKSAEKRDRREDREPPAEPPPVAEIPSALTRRPPVATPTPEPAAPARRAERPRRSAGPEQEFGFESATGSSGAGAAPSPPAATTATTSPPPSSGGGSTTTSSPPPTSGGEFLP